MEENNIKMEKPNASITMTTKTLFQTFTPKFFWFDCETTGLSPQLNDIWQIAFKIVIGGEVVAAHKFECRPTNMNTDRLSPEALAIGGVTPEYLAELPPSAHILRAIQDILKNYMDKFNRSDKLIPAGYKVCDFDVPFLREFFKKCGDKYYGSFFSNYPVDVYYMILACHAACGIQHPKYKLVDMCELYGVPLDHAHDALSDITATEKIFALLKDLYFRPQPITF